MSERDWSAGPAEPAAAGNGGQGPRGAAPVTGRRGALGPTFILLGVLAVLVSALASVWTEVLWYDSMGFRSVFFTELGAKILLGVVSGLVTGGLVAGSLIWAYRSRPIYAPSTPEQESLDRYREALEPLRRLATWAVPIGTGMLVGLAASSQWQTYLLWVNRRSFGVTDPEFGLDIGWFVFTVPWLGVVLGIVTMALLIASLSAAFTHYVYGGIQLSGRRQTTSSARLHLSILLAALALTRAASYWLERYTLTTETSELMTGIQYTGATAILPTKGILAIASLMCALMFLSVIFTQSWRIPVIGVVLLVVTAVVVGNVYPALIQSLRVKPSEKTLETPYLANNIAATRSAYGLSDVQVTQYNAATTASAEQLRDDAASVPGIRLLDPNVVSPTFKARQALKGYYQFPDALDVDRYQVNGREQDTVIAVREIDLEGVPDGQRNWLNDHTVYTHGYGVVAAYGNRTVNGEPVFLEQDIPTRGELGDYEPRIYFGEQSPAYSIVGAPAGASAREFDYPSSDGDKTNTYAGQGGVAIGSLPRRIAYALKYREVNFLLSDAVNSASRVLDVRNPRERVARVAPWLTLDGNVYPAVIDGRVLWIVDGYTTSAQYPNSRLTAIEDATEDSITQARRSVSALAPARINYIRNSVKATVDAFDGSVTLYQWDTEDPLLQAWSSAFPDTVKPRAEMSASLLEHVRYPEDLFKVQRELLSRYHVTNPESFYGGQDNWRVPVDPVQPGQVVQPPYYLSIAMPKQEQANFNLTTTFMPVGREVLAGFLAVDSDAGNTKGEVREGYGTMRLLALPKENNVNGPGQVQNDINSSNKESSDYTVTLSQFINFNNQNGSVLTRGNLITLPVGGGLLYVEPIFVQSSSGSAFPIQRVVVVAFGNQLAWANDLEGALDELFGDASGVVDPDPTNPNPTPSPTTPDASGGSALDKALADAQKAFADGEAALKRGDFTAYGEAQKRLKAALERAVAAQPEGGSLTVTPAPTATASAAGATTP